jgi:hypothetical protein
MKRKKIILVLLLAAVASVAIPVYFRSGSRKQPRMRACARTSQREEADVPGPFGRQKRSEQI